MPLLRLISIPSVDSCRSLLYLQHQTSWFGACNLGPNPFNCHNVLFYITQNLHQFHIHKLQCWLLLYRQLNHLSEVGEIYKLVVDHCLNTTLTSYCRTPFCSSLSPFKFVVDHWLNTTLASYCRIPFCSSLSPFKFVVDHWFNTTLASCCRIPFGRSLSPFTFFSTLNIELLWQYSIPPSCDQFVRLEASSHLSYFTLWLKVNSWIANYNNFHSVTNWWGISKNVNEPTNNLEFKKELHRLRHNGIGNQ